MKRNTGTFPSPRDRNGSIPDLEGIDVNGIRHLGEAETDMEAENLDTQLQRFSSWVMTDTKTPIPLHVIVPQRIGSQMTSRIHHIGLGDKLNDEGITVWHVKD